MSKAATKKSPAPTFDAAVKRLGEIVETLEEGDVPLEQALKLFEEGIVLSRSSQEKLDAAQKRIEELLEVDADGKAKTAEFTVRGDDE